jgi:undecaprenyl-diphosphatase
MIEIFILSLVQGITEFLPISSSSHLILVSKYINFENQGLSFDISLHIGSFLAVITYFRKDIINFIKNKNLFYKIFISSIPVMLVGFFLVKYNLIDRLRNIQVIGWATIIFGILLFVSDKMSLDKKIEKNFSYSSAIIIGILQIASLIPGVSRSGIGITAARFLQFDRYDSAKISFLLSIPILAAVSLFGISNLINSNNLSFSILNLTAIFLSFIFSYVTIKFFLQYIKKFSLNIFVIYRLVIGIILLAIYYL